MPFSFRSQIPSDHVTMALLTSDGMSTVELALYGVILVHVLALVRLPPCLVNYLRVGLGINRDLAVGLLGVGGHRGAAGGERGPGAQEGVIERGKTKLVFILGVKDALWTFCGLGNVLIKCAVLFLGLDGAWHDDWVGR